MELPLLAFCDGWLNVYATAEEAEVDIEPIDVENGAWEVFDPSGRVCALAVVEQRTRGLWRLFSRTEQVVRVTEPKTETADLKRLQALLMGYLAAVAAGEKGAALPPSEEMRGLPLEYLISRAIEMRRGY